MSPDHSRKRLRLVGYYRKSTDGQEASIPEQQDWARAKAKREGWDIVAEFVDEGISGSEFDRREGLWKMVAFCEEPPGGLPIDGMLFWNGNRFSRGDSIATAVPLQRLRDAGVNLLIGNDETIDLSSVLGRTLYLLKQEFAHSEFLRSHSENVARSQLRRAEEGQWPSGKVPYGYIRGEKGKLVPGDPEEVKWVKWAFNEYANKAVSLSELAKRLNDLGAKAPRNKKSKGKWRRDTLRLILKKRAYVGDIMWNDCHAGKFSRIKDGAAQRRPERKKRKRVKNDAADVVLVAGAHPALVDRDTFDRVQQKLKANRTGRSTPIQGGGVWVLTGLLRCGLCGEKMHGHKDTRKQGGKTCVYYQYECCSNSANGPGTCKDYSVLQDVVLKEVAETISASFTDPAKFARLQAQLEEVIRKEAQDCRVVVRDLDKRIADLDGKIRQGEENLLLISKDLIGGAEAALRRLQEDRGRLAKEREARTQTAKADAAAAARVAKAVNDLRAMAETITRKPPDVVRALLRELAVSITVHFDPSRPRHQSHYVGVELEMTPDAAYLLRPGVGAPR
jgi:DNA invertase Pin-like site-specific DNA recombinase